MVEACDKRSQAERAAMPASEERPQKSELLDMSSAHRVTFTHIIGVQVENKTVQRHNDIKK